jgi:hypothetical protein
MGESPLARGQHSEARQVAGWFALRRTDGHLAVSRLRECSQLFSVVHNQYTSKSRPCRFSKTPFLLRLQWLDGCP